MLYNKIYNITTKRLAYSSSKVIVTFMQGFRRVLMPVILVGLLCVGLLSPHSGSAEANESPLVIGQAKITANNGQFMTLYNNSADTIDMTSIQLAYYNSYDLSKATSNKFINLTGKLAPKNYYVVSDGALTLCYKMTVNAVSLGFSSTAGMVQVLRLSQAAPGGLVTTSLIDSLAWSKTTVSGAQTLPSANTDFLQRVWLDGAPKSVGSGTWQSVHPNPADTCDLQVQIAGSSTPGAETAPGATYPTRTVRTETEVSPANNLGLVAPELSELFPNPASPETDDENEFIELYNPNDHMFSLAGYRVEAGATYSRGYTFKEGALQPKSFTAIMITDTNLQLSNGEGQVRFLNPEGTTISETPAYEDAPDGSSFSLVGDSWDWSKTPTPNAANTNTAVDDKTGSTKPKSSSKSSSGR